MCQYHIMNFTQKASTDIGASKLVVAVRTSDVNVTGVNIGANLFKVSL